MSLLNFGPKSNYGGVKKSVDESVNKIAKLVENFNARLAESVANAVTEIYGNIESKIKQCIRTECICLSRGYYKNYIGEYLFPPLDHNCQNIMLVERYNGNPVYCSVAISENNFNDISISEITGFGEDVSITVLDVEFYCKSANYFYSTMYDCYIEDGVVKINQNGFIPTDGVFTYTLVLKYVINVDN